MVSGITSRSQLLYFSVTEKNMYIDEKKKTSKNILIADNSRYADTAINLRRCTMFR